jgi:PAS domain S-box-containing protein
MPPGDKPVSLLRDALAVVGVGASAGGLAALSAFFSELPNTTGLAFLVVQHTDTNHKSALPEILQRLTKMTVKPATEGDELVQDHIYIAPSDKDLDVHGTRLRLVPRTSANQPPLPIDGLFSSLARAYGPRAAGIVFSGTGTDGTNGLRDIKGAGGVTFAQDEHSAKYFGMPNNAIQAGHADHVLSPAEVARALLGGKGNEVLPAAREAVTSTHEASRVANHELQTAKEELQSSSEELTTLNEQLSQSLEQLKESEDQFRLLVSGVKDYAIFMIDPVGNILSWNTGAEQIKGYTAREIIGKHFSVFYTKEDQAAGKPQTELRIAKSEGRFEEEGLRMRKDGATFWANVVLTPIYREGKLSGFAKITRDITEKKRIHEKELQSEVRFRHLVSTVKDYAIFLLSPEGNIVSWNEGAERLKGYRANEIIGKHFSKFYGREDADKPDRELQIARTSGSCEDEGWRLRKDGSRFWANVVITAIKDDAGNFIGFSKVTRDLTERKRMEENLRKVNDELELKVEERTRNLSRLNRQLEESNSELAQFAFVASHDLQEPLRMVSTYLQFISKRAHDKLDEEDRKYIGFAVKGALRMKLLIEDLLSYAQIGTAKSRIQPIVFNSVVQEAQKNLEALIVESDSQIRVDRLPTLNGDPSQIVQLFQNLIGNAIKYRGEAPPEIHISAENQGEYWRFSVKDNGMGISPQYKDRIFVVFQRLHSDREKFPGTGIGLAICKKIVERHGGRLWVESQLGEGATFHFTFPK